MQQKALLLLLPLVLAASPAPAPERLTRMRPSMGTFYTVEAAGPGAEAAIAASFLEIDRLDQLLSTYKPDSELSRLNREGNAGWVPVSGETRHLLERSLAYAEASSGAFDPTVGPLVALWGFKHLDMHLPKPADIATTLRRVGYRSVAIDPQRGVRFARPGMALDLGAIAKGYAVDRALAVLKAAGMQAGRVDAGGNQGVFGPPQQGGAWHFGIRHPREEDELAGVLALQPGQGVATAGDAERGFWHHGVRYGHILDPRSGWPSQGVLSVTVVAPTAEQADALDTPLVVLGRDKGLALLSRYPGTSAVFIEAGSGPGEFRMSTSPGFPWAEAP